MPNHYIAQFSTTRWLIILITSHLLLWTLVPAMVRYNLPLDSIEGATWGHQLSWGYDKNPFLNGWLTALAAYLDHHSGWMIYLFSQLSVVICFWAVWRLAQQMLPPVYALLAVMLLELMQYYNFHAIDFNDNTLELGLWALTIYAFYCALRTPKLLTWIAVAIFAALGLMAKYYTAILLFSLACFLILDRHNRKQLATWPPYVALTIFLLIIMPHVLWLFSHDFVTVTYVFERTASKASWTNHLFFPAQFAWQQFEVFLPVIILSVLLMSKNIRGRRLFSVSTFDQSFLFYAGLGPFLLTLLLSFLFGIKLRAGWGMPLLSL